MTLQEGITYPFKEGDLIGGGQTFISGYTYVRNSLLSHPSK